MALELVWEKRMSVGIDGLKKVVLAAAELLNVASKIINKEGIFVAFQLADELTALSNLDAAALKAEVADLSPEEKLDLVNTFKQKLVLQKPEVEAKIEAGVDVLNDAVEVVVSAVVVVQKAKALLG